MSLALAQTIHPCAERVKLHIAVQFADELLTLDEYDSHVAKRKWGPAIWGLDSMQEKESVILLRKGKEMIAFPGPGGYEIKWSPGTKDQAAPHGFRPVWTYGHPMRRV